MNRVGIYLLANYPSRQIFLEAVEACQHERIDFLEVGFAFSDPVADGDLLEKASVEVLKRQTTQDFIDAFREARALFTKKLYIMTYSNIVYRLGVEEFVRRTGPFDGLILADLPLREVGVFEKELRRSGVSLIRFLTPESREEDMAAALRGASDFIYFVSKRGTTGGAFELDDQTRAKIAGIRGRGVDVCVGFGIQTRSDVELACRAADGAIIGTRAVTELEKGVRAFTAFVHGLKE